MSHIARSLVRVIGSTGRIVAPRVVAIRPLMNMNTLRSMATAAPAGGVQVSPRRKGHHTKKKKKKEHGL